jgi:hypothetical protein
LAAEKNNSMLKMIKLNAKSATEIGRVNESLNSGLTTMPKQVRLLESMLENFFYSSLTLGQNKRVCFPRKDFRV